MPCMHGAHTKARTMHLPSHLLTLDVEDVSRGGVAERAPPHLARRPEVDAVAHAQG